MRRAFAKTLKVLFPDPSPLKNIVVACSGGVDSMVLLDLLEKYYYYNGLKTLSRFTVCYVDHAQRTRKEVSKDKLCIQTYCENHGIKLKIKRLSLSKEASEKDLREARYQALKEVLGSSPQSLLFTAHHADDNLETFLFKLLRGAHPDTLKGIPAKSRRQGLLLARPLLGFSKHELLIYARAKNIKWNEDLSNQSSRYARNRIRHELLPLLEDLRPGAGRRLQTFFEALESKAPRARKSRVIVLKKQITSTIGATSKGCAFTELKSAIDLLLGEKAHRTTRAHWLAVKKQLDRRNLTQFGGGEKKIVQFPGKNILLFQGDRLFWTSKVSF